MSDLEISRLEPDSFAVYRQAADDLASEDCTPRPPRRIAPLRANPDDAASHFYLGLMLRDGWLLREALGEFQRAAQLEPRSADALCNLGLTWQELGHPGEAERACRAAVGLDPSLAAGWCNLGLALQSLGALEEAIDCFRTAVRLSPNDAALHSNLLYALNFRPRAERAALFAEHRGWAQRHADPFLAVSRPHDNDFSPNRRLRVGYVSAHFRQHAVNYFVEPILAAHDREQFEIVCYSDVSSGRRDATTSRLAGHADAWRDIAGQSDAQVSQLVRGDRIDILIDLAGHIGGNRLLVFARKPAPVQITYLGYQNTTGMQAMDYRLTDAWSDPPGTTERYFTETLLRLPRLFYCYRPFAAAPGVNELPAVRNGRVTFGSFNNFAKVGPEVLGAWAEVLARVPNSRLVLLVTATEAVIGRVRGVFRARGVDGERVQFAAQRPTDQFLRLFHQVDIALDAFPFNGHTTTCDSLWMGVPVVALAGDAYVSRFGSSALVQLGLRELVAGSRQEYVERAVLLAGDLDRLAALRAALRERMAGSSLVDGRAFTRDLEAALREAWQVRCARSLP